MPLQPGTTLGPYQVTAKIGEGGMGEVWQARDTSLDWDVALKVLPAAFTSDLKHLTRCMLVAESVDAPRHADCYGAQREGRGDD